ncbi:hypothetical protein T440DRAFT_79537 [Plenodomus tracheiphilus IPT5]|uniref:Uncharacterized protein n=1 Tax=Plenodomus tracheiphilus IPT5 TaxID=1408161 RepID=A0A6A7ALH8_9PLEO|nr:hypothetical protein T440DRAFT_79537 [Plenodomus tracheiphilus IPT5]
MSTQLSVVTPTGSGSLRADMKCWRAREGLAWEESRAGRKKRKPQLQIAVSQMLLLLLLLRTICSSLEAYLTLLQRRNLYSSSAQMSY